MAPTQEKDMARTIEAARIQAGRSVDDVPDRAVVTVLAGLDGVLRDAFIAGRYGIESRHLRAASRALSDARRDRGSARLLTALTGALATALGDDDIMAMSLAAAIVRGQEIELAELERAVRDGEAPAVVERMIADLSPQGRCRPAVGAIAGRDVRPRRDPVGDPSARRR